MILGPNIACIAGVFTLGFGIGASGVTNNIAALAELANGLLPMRRVAQLEAERRHLLEMELRQSGFLQSPSPSMRQTDLDSLLVSAAGRRGDNPDPYRTALAGD